MERCRPPLPVSSRIAPGRAVHQVPRVSPQVVLAKAVKHERGRAGPAHAYRIPERERHAEAIKAGAKVGRRGRHSNAHRV